MKKVDVNFSPENVHKHERDVSFRLVRLQSCGGMAVHGDQVHCRRAEEKGGRTSVPEFRVLDVSSDH